ncbi:hypothetical protein SETIT_5G083500v2 [Setaria italica]|uniref:SIAH-type domain-containing protein n=1 Tax=Setaria italica TaxID=4555 RepID=K3XQS3_SETIT|nr:hypothetical protein SETIT_5G083500v2 [Setaria italica]
MEKLQQPNGKKARLESPGVEVKQEVQEEGQSSGGGAATVAVEVAAPRVEVVVNVDKALLHCSLCAVTFKPPISQFQSKCYSCFQDGAYSRNKPLEDVVGSLRVPCTYDVCGCRAYVAYHNASEHKRECPWAPFACAEPGCAFAGSPPMLRDHLRDAHAWPVEKVRYSHPYDLRLPESQPRRLLYAEEDDGRVFLVSVGAHGGARHGAGVACVSAAAAAGPEYFCKMWAIGNPSPATGRVEFAMVEADVPSISSVPGDAATYAAPLSVPRSMLHGESMEMHLRLRIEKATK